MNYYVSRHRPFVLIFLLLCNVQVWGITVTNTASKDNTLYDTGTSTELSDGAGATFTIGRTKENLRRRAVLAFTNLNASIPAGAIITNVSLRLYMEQCSDTTLLRPTSLYRLSADWGEGTSNVNGGEGKGTTPSAGDVTWVHRFYPTNVWNTPGGDFFAGTRATTMVPNTNGYSTWSSANLIADVQAWVNTGNTNFGWLIIGDESTNHTARQFSSRESTKVNQRPILIVSYTTAETVGACYLPDGSCNTLTSNQCFAVGGTWAGANTTCPPPTGACCLANGNCTNVTAAQCASLSGTYQGDGAVCTSNLCPIVLTPFVDALPIPATLQPSNGVVGGTAYYEVRLKQFTQTLHRDLPPTTLWGYNGTFPGPVILASNGQPVTVKWINDLRTEGGTLRTNHYLAVDTCVEMAANVPRTVTHLHGGHVPPESDGYPMATQLPGESVRNVYPNNQKAAMIWFHDHAMGITRLNVYMGLAGLYIIRDAAEAALSLPSGQYEIPLVIQDRQFNPDGTLNYPATWTEHFFGDKILVNGKVWPYLNVKQGKYRFRILDGCNSRTLVLGLSSGAMFQQIGTDGGLLSAPVITDQIRVGPGERTDVVINFAAYAPGSEILLTNSAPAPFPGTAGVGVVTNVLKFVVTAGAGYTNALPSSLVTVTPLSTNNAVRERTFTLGKQSDSCTGERWLINGLGWNDITEFPVLNTTEVWDFVNPSGMAHPMHMHLVLFQVVDRQSFTLSNNVIVPTGPRTLPAPGEAGWKDTVLVNPFEIVRVIAKFEDYTGKYPYHCHILEHEDQAMMRQFQVIYEESTMKYWTSNSSLVLQWIGPNWQLQSSSDLVTWTNDPVVPTVNGFTNTAAFIPTNRQWFFRLKK